MKLRYIIFCLSLLIIPTISDARTDVLLQNRTINVTWYGFNEYIMITNDFPGLSCFQFNIEYDKNYLSIVQFRFGDMFKYIPEGKWLSFEAVGQNNSYYGGMILSPWNRSQMFTTYGTFTFRPLQKGITYIGLNNVSACYSDQTFSPYWNTPKYQVNIT